MSNIIFHALNTHKQTQFSHVELIVQNFTQKKIWSNKKKCLSCVYTKNVVILRKYFFTLTKLFNQKFLSARANEFSEMNKNKIQFIRPKYFLKSTKSCKQNVSFQPTTFFLGLEFRSTKLIPPLSFVCKRSSKRIHLQIISFSCESSFSIGIYAIRHKKTKFPNVELISSFWKNQL